MPELAEVEFYRRRWAEAATGQTVRQVRCHRGKRVFRGTDVAAVERELPGRPFVESHASGKQMVFRFGDNAWLGVHLGMSGELSVAPPSYSPSKHDHLVINLTSVVLVFTDPRMFGRIRFDVSDEPPAWWAALPGSVLSRAFTQPSLARFLERRRGAPIKAVLLMQEFFPGIGNWMADEILWRAGIHPTEPAGQLNPDQVSTLWRQTRTVARDALRRIAGVGGDLPPDLNVHIPESWLFHHRWRNGGRCPKTGVLLERAEIGGRTTCWSPALQKRSTRTKRTAAR